MNIPEEIVFLLCGWSAINGIFLGLYLYFNKSVKKNEANKLLGAIFFLISFKVAYRILFIPGPPTSLIHFLYSQWTVFSYMMVGTLVFFYTKSLLKNIFYFKKSHLLYVFTIVLILFVPRTISGFKIRYFLIQSWVLVFLILSVKELVVVKFIEKNDQKQHLFTWLIALITGEFIIWLTVLGEYFIELVAFFSFIICLMIYILIEKKGIIHSDYTQSKSTRLQIEKEEEQNILSRLNLLMENEKLYLNTELSLPVLAQKLNVPLYMLSKIINEKLQKNFSEYVNSYRINEAKKRLIDEKFTHLSIAGIAYDCGFNSLSTFNTFFKKYTNTTPSQFKKLQFELSYQQN